MSFLYFFMGCFAFHFQRHAHCILIGLGEICYKFIETSLCNIIELHVLNYQVLYTTLVPNFFILHVTHVVVRIDHKVILYMWQALSLKFIMMSTHSKNDICSTNRWAVLKGGSSNMMLLSNLCNKNLAYYQGRVLKFISLMEFVLFWG